MIANACRHCGKPLLPENATVADGCRCNSGRGINHGLVDTLTCTCTVCDPARTGGSRFRAMSSVESFTDLGNGIYTVHGTCACGFVANMEWAYIMSDGSLIPRCGKCRNHDHDHDHESGRYAKLTKEAFDYFTTLHVMTA